MNPAAGTGAWEGDFEHLLVAAATWLAARGQDFAATGGKADRPTRWLGPDCRRNWAFHAPAGAASHAGNPPRDPLLLVLAPRERRAWLAAGTRTDGNAPVGRSRGVAVRRGDGPVPDANREGPGGAAGPRAADRRQPLAAASRARIESGISLLNALSLVAVISRRPCSCAKRWKSCTSSRSSPPSPGAWTISTALRPAAHPRLCDRFAARGVAIDWQVPISTALAAARREPYGEKLRRLLKPLLASCPTTVIGFSLLLFSDLPLIRQIGVFTAAGCCARSAPRCSISRAARPPAAFEGRVIGGLAGRGLLRVRLAVRWAGRCGGARGPARPCACAGTTCASSTCRRRNSTPTTRPCARSSANRRSGPSGSRTAGRFRGAGGGSGRF